MLPTGRHQVGISSGGHSWAEGDRRVELQIVASRSVPNIGSDHPGIVFASPAFADSEQEAEKALALLGTCPAIDRAIVKIPYAPVDLPTWYDGVMTNYLADHRYSADNMWTSASAEDLLPGIRRMIETIPPQPSQFLWLNWGPSPSAMTWPTAWKTRSTWRATAVGTYDPDERLYGWMGRI